MRRMPRERTVHMMSRPARTRLVGPTITALVLLALAGCASRSLNAPTVVDWSEGGPPPVQTPPVASATTAYVVKAGDTLASIAKQLNVTPADLAAWNNLAPTARLQPNQVLRIVRPDGASPVAIPQPIGPETIEQRPLGPSTPPPSSSNAPLKNGPLGVKRPYSDATLAEMSKPDGDAPAAAPTQPDVAVPPPPTAIGPSGTPAWGWPASGKAANGFVDGKSKGIDIAGKAGDPIVAAADGKVTFAGSGVRGYGNFIIVQHTPSLLSVYANNRANLIKEGTMVTRGQRIAEMGATGSEAPKLHFEIRSDSNAVDPMKYLPPR